MSGILAIQKASGGVLNVTSTDGATSTDLVLPLSGTVLSKDVNGNVGVNVSPTETLHIKSTTGNTVLKLDSSAGVSSGINLNSPTYNYLNGNSNLGIQVNGTEKIRIDSAGNVLVTGSGGLGYGTGSGGTVTQLTSKSTAVTLNRPSGQITMNNSALASGASVTFTLYNTLIDRTSGDVVYVTQIGGTTLNYRVRAVTENVACYITIENVSGGSLSEALQLNFIVLKGATA